MFGLIPFNNGNNPSFHNLFSYLDNIEKSFFGVGEPSISQFRADIKDNGSEYLLEAELPGFSKEDINIDIDGDRLVISANHEEKTETNQNNYVCKERKYGTFSRSFDISGIEQENLSASYDNGLLTLHMPKKQIPSSTTRRLDIK